MTAPTPFDSNAPLGSRRAIIRRNPDDVDEIEMIEAHWGSDPRFSGGASFRFLPGEGRTFPDHRCLIPASEFHMTVRDKRYRVTLDGENHFYLAGIWEPPMGDFPMSYKVITVAANAEVERYQSRQGAIIQRRQVMSWLDATMPETDLITTLPPRTFLISEIGAQSYLAI